MTKEISKRSSSQLVTKSEMKVAGRNVDQNSIGNKLSIYFFPKKKKWH
jgi:hypothetical protein